MEHNSGYRPLPTQSTVLEATWIYDRDFSWSCEHPAGGVESLTICPINSQVPIKTLKSLSKLALLIDLC